MPHKQNYHSWMCHKFVSRKELGELPIKTPNHWCPTQSEKMAFNPSSENEKRVMMNPKNLRFTQLDIAASFSDPEYPKVKEAVSLIRRRQLDPALFGDLTVHRDKEGVVWCESNRRLYVLRMAEVPSVRVKFVNNDYISRRIKEEDKNKLNDPAFMPRIRGEPLGSISGSSVCEEQQGASLLGVAGAALVAGYWGWKLYKSQQDNDEDGSMNPKDLRFTQPDIKSTFQDATLPTVKESVSLIRRGELNPAVYGELTVHRDEDGVVWCENNRRLYVLRMAGVSSVRVKFNNSDFQSRKLKDRKKEMSDPAFMPKIRGEASGSASISGPSDCQEVNETSLLGAVGSVAAALFAGWKLYKSKQDNE